MRILYFDCQSGISGDMTIGALLDLGIDRREFLDQIGLLNLTGYRIRIEKKRVGSLSATDFEVVLDDSQDHRDHRNLFDIEKLIMDSGLSKAVKEASLRIFRCIAEAEARVHDRPVEEIHFHEVGAVDSIIDIVGTAIGISLLRADAIHCSPLPLGSGFVECAHGLLPVPAPATVEILKGVPVYSTGVEGELVTPTGAAIARCLSGRFGPLPAMELERTGYGRGKKYYGIPNVLRLFLGRELPAWVEAEHTTAGGGQD